jgi:hypothetical protein
MKFKYRAAESIPVLLFLLLAIRSAGAVVSTYNNNPRIEHTEIEATTESFNNMLVLIKPDIYVLYWSHNDTDILFELHAKTPGMLSFGLSPDGSMGYSDIILAWINEDGIGHFSGLTPILYTLKLSNT